MEAVSKYRRCLEERSQAELQERVQKAILEAQEAEGGCPNRDVTPVWKLSITDANDLQNDRGEPNGYHLHSLVRCCSSSQFNLLWYHTFPSLHSEYLAAVAGLAWLAKRGPQIQGVSPRHI